MKFIDRAVPSLDDFLALPTENVAWLVLQELSPNHRTQEIHGTKVTEYVTRQYQGGQVEHHLYRGERRDDVQLALAEAWGWLQANGLLAPHPLAGEKCTLTRRAKEVKSEKAFDDYRKASAVPWDVIHPSIRDIVRTLVLTGLYDSAILEAFKRVEVAVRKAAQFGNEKYGASLMREAFKAEAPHVGPLTDINAGKSEREATAHLFTGVIGHFKNPQSHQIVGVDEVTQTVEIIMFASHLLRIVDMRK